MKTTWLGFALLACNGQEAPKAPETTIAPTVVDGSVAETHDDASAPRPSDATDASAPTASSTPDSSPAPVADVRCKADTDCLMTNFAGCCAPCDAAPHMIKKADYDRESALCAVVDCMVALAPRCEPVEPAAHFRSICVKGTCLALRGTRGM